jgi:hypothetical protein
MVDFRGSMLDSQIIGSEVGCKKDRGGKDEERWGRRSTIKKPGKSGVSEIEKYLKQETVLLSAIV